ncbi:MAG: Fe-S cluster assembly protein SufD [Longimicrobiales bacterium]
MADASTASAPEVRKRQAQSTLVRPASAAMSGVTAHLNIEAVHESARGGPDWLGVHRLDAWHAYEALPLPTRQLEEWRYTDISLFKLDKVRPVITEQLAGVPDGARALLQGREAAGTVLQVDGNIAEITLDRELESQGVLLLDLAVAAHERRDLLEKYLGAVLPFDANKFAALNTALWAGGVFLYVPRGVRIDKPIRVARWLSEGGTAVFPRTLIVAEEGSHAGFVEEFGSPDFDQPALSCAVVEIAAAQAANLQYVALQRWGNNVRHIHTQRTIAGRDANLDSLVVNLGATVARLDLAASLEGPGARSDMLGLYFARGTQHFDHSTRQDHKVPHASSDLLYKGALYDRARSIFRGLIKVWPGAQRTDAYQTNRNLLLSDRAEATSLPNLEIEADDVRCSHAATVGHLDQEELFYIMSRGVPRAIAERLVVFGFLGEVFERLPMPGVIEELRTAIEEKIGS